MRPVIIVMSHGSFSQALVNSAKMIIGEIENIFVISMLDHDGLEGTNQKLSTILQSFNNETEIVILADLKGGTPCNVAVMKMNQYPNLKVVTGVNLPMLIEASLSEIQTSEELARFLLKSAIAAIEICALIKINSKDEEYDE